MSLPPRSAALANYPPQWLPVAAAPALDPKRLDQIENELKSNRIADPDGLVKLLEKIEGDQRVMNYARDHAGRIKRQIQTRK